MAGRGGGVVCDLLLFGFWLLFFFPEELMPLKSLCLLEWWLSNTLYNDRWQLLLLSNKPTERPREGFAKLSDVQQTQYNPCLAELHWTEHVDEIIYATQNYQKQRKNMDKHMQ